MMKDALFAGVNAAVLTPMHADLSIDLDRMAAHCRWLLAQWLQRPGGPGHHRRGQQPGHQRAHRDPGGSDRARHSGGEDAAGHGHHRDHRHRAADQQGARSSAAAAPCYCRRSITRTRPTTGCWPISPR